jgi:hypothetical protein
VAHRQDPDVLEEQTPPPPFTIRISMSYHPCVEAGTTTFAKEAVAVLADRHGMGVLLTGPSHTAIEESTHAPVKDNKNKIGREGYQ